MAPGRGASPAPRDTHTPSGDEYESGYESASESEASSPDTSRLQQDDAQKALAEKGDEGQNFTVRGVFVGLAIGVLIAFSNAYFGLQTGWISGMAMPAALIGFGVFKSLTRCLKVPFSPVENVLVQTVAGAVGTMPLGCGFVGVLPALQFLLKPEENGPMSLSTGNLIIWAIGICFFGVVFAVPLRKEVIIREQLKFPSGTATALTIGVLHGNSNGEDDDKLDSGLEIFRQRSLDLSRSTTKLDSIPVGQGSRNVQTVGEQDHRLDWKAEIRLLLLSFAGSAVYTLFSYFVPQVHGVPILGLPLAQTWLWELNPSPAYVGQGIIMGPATTLHMLLGAIIGWAILSPIAKHKGWAPGPVEDWETGSKGWIVWVSLAIMLADAMISLGFLVLRPLVQYGPSYYTTLREQVQRHGFKSLLQLSTFSSNGYTPLVSTHTNTSSKTPEDSANIEHDAPDHHLVSNRTTLILFILSVLICIASIRYVFPPIPIYAILLSIVLALLLGVMGVRALGETDLNPVSGISKLTQLFFALVIPSTNPNAITINLIAGAISESGALQAGDMMQDLKTGHLLGASPKAQFWGQMIGSLVGAVVSAGVYKLYTSVYEVPGGLFQVPTAYVWIFTARLVTGKGLPEVAWQFAVAAGAIFAVLTLLRAYLQGSKWQAWVPGGIAVAVGMYNVPSFTLARAVGGLIAWYWSVLKGNEETPVVVLASGLILGEGVVSIVNLVLASFKVPHL
ncbi:uncharacterized protein KY384_007092 [Bacidia gigantensis]|uniref:uncharacterized protein n=1 Tax=Bacidia gigantensis TaxID=2732470 RepID=UPI001D04F6D0|nr:uncharacterized protein KY384_007092 [Bacidia gigantensis]KAG8528175.1 hypothetical protein KY384_007092 [Bacidia gigantensis]